ncbi:MAG: hypothetical protein HWD61_08685 [Parachlamydiaceae bacterium]|nr:MAG: hypothetical protein HWD61_08685 [Parachlamydiaceae bacterium]
MKFEILESGIKGAQENMDIDQTLLQEISSFKHLLLRFYDWSGPSATYGYFIDPMKWLNAEGLKSQNIQLGRRPTGGGIVFHITDFAFSVLVPATHPAYSVNTLENYAFINNIVGKAIKNFRQDTSPCLLTADAKSRDESCKHFCMAKPTIYDVMVDGKKAGGAAQRRTRDGFLHQGTISLIKPEEKMLKEILKPETQVLEAMKSQSYALVGSDCNETRLQEARAALRDFLVSEFKK